MCGKLLGPALQEKFSERTPQQVAETVCFTSTASCFQLLMQSLMQTSSPSNTKQCQLLVLSCDTNESYTERDVSVRSKLYVVCCLDEHD